MQVFVFVKMCLFAFFLQPEYFFGDWLYNTTFEMIPLINFLSFKLQYLNGIDSNKTLRLINQIFIQRKRPTFLQLCAHRDNLLRYYYRELSTER